jgi:hypothetical protein
MPPIHIESEGAAFAWIRRYPAISATPSALDPKEIQAEAQTQPPVSQGPVALSGFEVALRDSFRFELDRRMSFFRLLPRAKSGGGPLLWTHPF